MNRPLTSFIFLLSLLLISNAHALSIDIRVGVHAQPPLQFNQQRTGAAYEIVNALNTVQKEFNFIMVPTPVKRKYKSKEEGWIDITIFDNPKWGWQQTTYTSIPLLHTQDIFIGLKSKIHDQIEFKQLLNKEIVLVRGYHYNFLRNRTDERVISKKYNITLVNSETELIKMVLLDRADIGVVNNITLNWFLKNNPKYKNKIIRSDFFDNEIDRFFLVFDASPIKVEELNKIILKAQQQNLLAPIYKKYGMQQPLSEHSH